MSERKLGMMDDIVSEDVQRMRRSSLKDAYESRDAFNHNLKFAGGTDGALTMTQSQRSAFHNMKQSRSLLRRAYRQAKRRGNYMAAYGILQKANNSGLRITGIQKHGEGVDALQHARIARDSALYHSALRIGAEHSNSTAEDLMRSDRAEYAHKPVNYMGEQVKAVNNVARPWMNERSKFARGENGEESPFNRFLMSRGITDLSGYRTAEDRLRLWNQYKQSSFYNE